MRIVKALILLVMAVWFGFLIHFNWNWLSKEEPIVSFVYERNAPAAEMNIPFPESGEATALPAQGKSVISFQTKRPLPMWAYLVAALFLGAFVVALGAFRDIYISRRDRRKAVKALQELKIRYDIPDDQEKSLSGTATGRDDSGN